MFVSIPKQLSNAITIETENFSLFAILTCFKELDECNEYFSSIDDCHRSLC